MNSIESTLDQITDLLQKLYGAPAILLVLVACIVLGYALRYIKSFPNSAIPLAVTLFGAVVFPIIADANNDITMRVWLVRNVLIGLVVGFASWLAHNKFLKPLEDKFFPDAPATAPAPAPEPPKTP